MCVSVYIYIYISSRLGKVHIFSSFISFFYSLSLEGVQKVWNTVWGGRTNRPIGFLRDVRFTIASQKNELLIFTLTVILFYGKWEWSSCQPPQESYGIKNNAIKSAVKR